MTDPEFEAFIDEIRETWPKWGSQLQRASAYRSLSNLPITPVRDALTEWYSGSTKNYRPDLKAIRDIACAHLRQEAPGQDPMARRIAEVIEWHNGWPSFMASHGMPSNKSIVAFIEGRGTLPLHDHVCKKFGELRRATAEAIAADSGGRMRPPESRETSPKLDLEHRCEGT